MEKNVLDLEYEKLLQKEKSVSKVVNRYLKMKIKKNIRKLTGINLK
jgi:predicted CopG family antitoxin